MSDIKDYAESMSLVRHMLEHDPEALAGVHIAAGFEDADFVLRAKEFRVLHESDGFGRDVQAPILGGTLARVDGPDHFRRRRIESMLFRSPTLRGYEATVLHPAIERVLAEARQSHAGSGPARADLHDIGEAVLGEVVAALVGLDGLDTTEGRRRFDSFYQDIDNGVRISWASQDVHQLAAKGVAALNELTEHFITPSRRRRKEMLDRVASGEANPDDPPTDLITLMLQHHGDEFDDGLMIREIALYVTASVTTLTNQVCYCVHHIEEWVQQHPRDAPRRVDPVFLSRSLQESVRLHAGPVLMRRATEDVVLPSGTAVKAGEFAWVVIRQASQDGAYFGESPESFNPYREVAAGVLPYGVEFGVGRHTCVGKRFALGDEPGSVDALEGAGVILMRTLYEAGMRLDPERGRTFVPELLDVHQSSPILLTALN
ncbi:cytochrome P450 [Phytohabitans suffuscus]|uniref:cytochrome P450 n=1 Tax=Phytohabitans suffuscus TaxID=624315 RepID=UPI001567068E|nr:cytochrome P450 [Phytohabitans suffuscus]